MQCERCHGRLIRDCYVDMESSGPLWLMAWRCINCGNVVDKEILEHRHQHHSVVRRGRPSHGFPQPM